MVFGSKAVFMEQAGQNSLCTTSTGSMLSLVWKLALVSARGPLKRRFLRYLADIGNAGGHRIERDKMGATPLRDQMRERGLAHSRRTVEDKRHEPVGLDGPAQEFSRPQNMLLPHEFRQVLGPHSPRERRLRAFCGQGL
jgi:hypothetical protein